MARNEINDIGTGTGASIESGISEDAQNMDSEQLGDPDVTNDGRDSSDDTETPNEADGIEGNEENEGVKKNLEQTENKNTVPANQELTNTTQNENVEPTDENNLSSNNPENNKVVESDLEENLAEETDDNNTPENGEHQNESVTNESETLAPKSPENEQSPEVQTDSESITVDDFDDELLDDSENVENNQPITKSPINETTKSGETLDDDLLTDDKDLTETSNIENRKDNKNNNGENFDPDLIDVNSKNENNDQFSFSSDPSLPESNTRNLKPEELGYQNGTSAPLSEKRSDLQRAQDDLDYVNEQERAYTKAVEEGRAAYDPNIYEAFNDAREEAQKVKNDVENGMPYEQDPFYQQLRTPEMQETIGNIYDVAEAVCDALDLPTAPNGDAVKSFLQVAVPLAVEHGPDIAQQMHDTYDTEGQKFMDEFNSKFPLRDQDGNPVDAAGNSPTELENNN